MTADVMLFSDQHTHVQPPIKPVLCPPQTIVGAEVTNNDSRIKYCTYIDCSTEPKVIICKQLFTRQVL